MAAAEDNDAERIAALEAQLAAKDAQLEKLQLHIVELEAAPEKSAPSEWVSPTSKGVGNKSCFFQKLRDLFRSKDFTVYAANELDKAYCVLEGCVHTPIDEFQRERIACCWASIPAADAVAHQMAFQYMTRRQDAELSDDEELPSFDRADSLSMLDDANAYIEKQGKEGITMIEQDYLEGLRDLTSSKNLSCEQVFLAVNCAHLAFRSGLPFREMTSSDYGPLLSQSRNKPVCHITQLDREKSFTLICKAAQLILSYLEGNHPDESREATDVFLGGSCNPTTWRRDTAMPQLEAAGTTYYNPQVLELVSCSPYTFLYHLTLTTSLRPPHSPFLSHTTSHDVPHLHRVVSLTADLYLSRSTTGHQTWLRLKHRRNNMQKSSCLSSTHKPVRWHPCSKPRSTFPQVARLF